MRRLIFSLIALAGIAFAAGAQDILEMHPEGDVVPRLLTARKPAVQWGAPKASPSWTVLLFSDIHGDCENLGRIVRFRRAYARYIDAAIHTGDAVYCYFDNPNPWSMVDGAGELMNAVGNHDCWKGHLLWSQTERPYDATKEDAYGLLLAPYIAGWDVVQPKGVDKKGNPHYRACYYYKDYPESDIRLIVLDCMHYDQAQHGWFAETLSDAAGKGLQVVAVQHFPPESGLDSIESGFTERDETIGPVYNPERKQMERMNVEAYDLVDDFIDKGGSFVAWMSGHTHQDFIGHVSGHARQFQIIVDKAGEGDDYMQEDRTRGTVNQDAFDLVTVNTSRHLVIIDRIGCTRDQYMRGKHLLVYDYVNRKVLVNE